MTRASSISKGQVKLASYSDGPQIRDFIKSQVFGTIHPITVSEISNPDIKNRTIIITGANTGIGLQTAKQMAQIDCVSRLILACRNLSKGEAARNVILAGVQDNRKGSIDVHVWQLDMSVSTSIVAFADRAGKELDRIDAVVLNAGVDLVAYQRALQKNRGLEMTLMVNVIGTVLLAVLMVPVLREKRSQSELAPRITIVGSAVQFFAKYDVLLQAAQGQTEESILEWLSNETRWDGKITEERYYLSKGMLQMLVQHLAAKVSQSAKDNGKKMIVLNCVAPGYCRTELFEQSGTAASRMALRLIGWDGSVGARALITGAIGKEGDEKSHGGYMSHAKVKKHSAWFETTQGREIGEHLWREMVEIMEETQPGAEKRL